MEIKFIKYRRIFYIFSASLVGLSIASIFVFGLNLGIDFTGGSVLEVEYKTEAPSLEKARESLGPVLGRDFVLQQTSEKGLAVKVKSFEEEMYQEVLEKLKILGEIKEDSESFQSIGSVIGQELKSKTKIVVVLTLISILLYIAFSFRKISRPVKSYIYGISGIIALFHDVLITLGVLIVLGQFKGVEITIPIITALLTIFGYSINDTVVVFDRLRENLLQGKGVDFNSTVNSSLNQSLTRSINTSLTTIIALLAIFFFGGVSLKYFSLALIIGITVGTYSSLFLATPLLTTYLRLKDRKYLKGV